MVFVLSHVLLPKFLFLYSLFSFTFTTCFPQIQPKCHQYESQALLQFKEGFVIDNLASDNLLGYPKTATWNSSTDCCSWDGIKCHEHTNHVIHVDLRSSQLYGTMDANSSLFRLVHLQVLDLSDNDFNYSQIPSKIGELSQLRYLNISRTTFFDEIPPQVSQLSKLLSLDLRVNHTSSLNTVNLLQLKFSSLKSIIQNSTKLEILLLSFVTISSTIPETITNLTSLKALSLYNSELYGQFPVGVFHLPNLEYLDLRYNPNLNGSLPEFQSSSLTKLALDHTGFSGTLPVSIGKLSSLVTLSIPNCHFFGYIPSSLGNLTQLKQIYLRNNKFRGDPSASLTYLTQLSFLDISHNEFTIETFSWVGKFSSLVLLDISSYKIGSDISLSFANLTQLEFLNAYDCNIKGEIPSWVMNLTNLVVLDLSVNSLHGKLELDTFLNLKKLVVLDLSFNNITSIPNWLWKKASLQDIDVSHNSLTGEISPSICNLKSLMALDLSFNNLRGNIPSCLGNFSQTLEILYLKGNKLSGLIPLTYMEGNSLQQIDLSNNNLQGQLPMALVNNRRLEFFDVSYNNINDTFPFWLGGLPS